MSANSSLFKAAGQAARAAAAPSMWSRAEPFAIGDRIDHLAGEEWYPATVTEYTPKGQPTPWRVGFDYEGGGSGAVMLDDEFNHVRFVHFRIGDTVLHESGGEWYPATVTAYTGQGQPTPWRVEFEYDSGGVGAVMLDDEFNTVVRAAKPEPEPEPEPEPSLKTVCLMTPRA